MPIKSITNRRLYRQIADQINRLIETGEYRPGRRLPAERILAVELGVSRPSVREALIALEVAGQINFYEGAGAFVKARPQALAPDATPLTATSAWPPLGPFEVLYARDLIEPEIAALAARNASTESRTRIARTLSEMACCLASYPKHVDYDRCFHFILAETSGNGALVQCMEALWVMRVKPLYPGLQGHPHNETFWQLIISEHREILEAVVRGDAKAARAAMRRHLQNERRRVAVSSEAER